MQLPLPTSDQALPGRDIPIEVSDLHFVNGNRIKPPFEDDIEIADFALGCFWGAERKFWEVENIYSTAVGYMGGFTPNASYEEVCSGLTGHTETVRVFYKPSLVDYNVLLKTLSLLFVATGRLGSNNDCPTIISPSSLAVIFFGSYSPTTAPFLRTDAVSHKSAISFNLCDM